MNALLLDIHRFSLNDGPGIRTTVFLKGCPLSCNWCHNPESIKGAPEIALFEERCIDCGACVSICPTQSQRLINGKHSFDRSNCSACGLCIDACSYNALNLSGKNWDLDSVLNEVMKDQAYYAKSSGGVTLSGGEPMNQFSFALELFKQLEKAGVNTCLDTCGYAPTERYLEILPYTRLILFDYKVGNNELHKKLTGVSNNLILENLDILYHKGADIELRCPLIPGVNDFPEQLRNIVELEVMYPNLTGITLMPYHDIARSKYQRYGYDFKLKNVPPANEEHKRHWIDVITSFGGKKIKLAQ